MTRARGTLQYVAPEQLTSVYSSAVDIFAVGCTFFALVMGSWPRGDPRDGFPDRFIDRTASDGDGYTRRLLDRFLRHDRDPTPQFLFLEAMTQAAPEDRPTATEALDRFAEFFRVPTATEVGEVPPLPAGAFYILPSDYVTMSDESGTYAVAGSGGGGATAGSGAGSGDGR